ARRIERLGVSELAEQIRRGEPDLQILDVRERSEWEAGHVAGSVFEAWHDITGVPDGLDPARPIAVVCASGQRAATAASLLERYGAQRAIHVVDGGVPKLGQLDIELQTGERAVAAT
ncbi:MAG TPA: rhodanese-like domain-containing protein, partial [Solirubrobacteraceae bacterium]|nr:rhodanese-like domain-containing protein [Solirubrobacteraceae bacterium]